MVCLARILQICLIFARWKVLQGFVRIFKCKLYLIYISASRSTERIKMEETDHFIFAPGTHKTVATPKTSSDPANQQDSHRGKLHNLKNWAKKKQKGQLNIKSLQIWSAYSTNLSLENERNVLQ